MKLEDLLKVTNEHTVVHVMDYNSGKVISTYDGRNSIDPALNGKEVVFQMIMNGQLYIEVIV